MLAKAFLIVSYLIVFLGQVSAQTEDEELRTLLKEFPSAYDRGSVDEKRGLLDRFMSIDPFSLTPLWRNVFLEKRLWWDQISGNVADIVAIRDEMMLLPPERRHISDTDILLQIVYYYTTVTVFPPNDRLSNPTREFTPAELMWWKREFKSDSEAEKILEHIVNNYISDDCIVFRARAFLSKLQGQQPSKFAKSKTNLGILEATSLESIKGHAKRDVNTGDILSSDTVRQRMLSNLKGVKKSLPRRHLDFARNLP